MRTTFDDHWSTLDRVRRMVAKHQGVPVESIGPETSIRLLDSLDLVELIMELEDELRFEAPDIFPFHTIGELADWIDRHR